MKKEDSSFLLAAMSSFEKRINKSPLTKAEFRYLNIINLEVNFNTAFLPGHNYF